MSDYIMGFHKEYWRGWRDAIKAVKKLYDKQKDRPELNIIPETAPEEMLMSALNQWMILYSLNHSPRWEVEKESREQKKGS